MAGGLANGAAEQGLGNGTEVLGHEGFTLGLVVSDGNTPGSPLRGPQAPGANPASVALFFFPDGSATTAAGDSLTFFIATISSQRRERRVAVLPLQSQPIVMANY